MATKSVAGFTGRLADKLYEKFGEKYANIAGYRKMGLRFDDLLIEEHEAGQEALRRLPEMESYARVYRFRRALQTDLKMDLLPEAEWTKPEDDIPYLSPIIAQVKAEIRERDWYDTWSPNHKKPDFFNE